ncbi:putative DNA-binding domain-containing protein [Myxococcus sp. Y35]|uniref:HvfC/BufC family peptide modification chaperone n=1 Tax=Pseudomyxococcus flavus TaxID=3115648 RepID=UPI003CE9A209
MTSFAETETRTGGPSLRELQTWFLTVITAPGFPARGHTASSRCEAFVRGARGLGAPERVAIYAQGYLARLQECLRADFPALRALVGEALFERFVVGYLWSSPPRSYDLFELGAGLAGYLERTRPPDSSVPEERRALLDLPADLARVERARLEALRAPGLEGTVTSPDISPYGLLLGTEVVVATAPCLRLVEARHDVRPFLAAVERGIQPEAPPPARTVLAVSRMDFRPTMAPLHDWQRVTLEGCATPRPLPQLAKELAVRVGETEGAMLAELTLWLPVAREQGLVTLTERERSQVQSPLGDMPK